MKIGRHLKHFRKAQKLGQRALGEKVGVKLTAISRWEREDVNPNLEATAKLADALGVTLDELCGKTPQKLSVVEQLAQQAAALPKDKQKVLEAVLRAFLKG